MKKKQKILRWFIIMTIVGCIFVCAAFFVVNSSPRVEHDESFFEVYTGDTGTVVASRLAEKELIRSKYFFYAIALYKKGVIKAGCYKISSELSSLEIYELLVSGEQEYIRITIPEGLTLSKIAAILDSNDITSAGAFTAAVTDPVLLRKYSIPSNSAEGYLFPDTYFLTRHSPATNVVESFLQQFFSQMAIIAPEIADNPQKLFETVILASIVEKEYRDPVEIKRIAGVFRNRLILGMGLQSCATVVYITTELLGRPHTGYVTLEDIKIDSPYNTYLWAGLPPGPISNPGRTALDAASNPEHHRFLYFRLVDEKNGHHFFSKTLDEHVLARKMSVKR